MNKKELSELSKIELEKLGREKGVELDRRYNKKTLINQLYDLFTKKTAVQESISEEKTKPTASTGFRVKPGKSNS
jgi:hypothetical protein